MAAVAEHFDVRDAIGIGHSSGGHTTVQAAALRPQTYRALLLVDPTIFPIDCYGTEPLDASFTLRRRNVWTSPDEMFERFKDRLPFSAGSPRSCATTAITACCRATGNSCSPARPPWRRRSIEHSKDRRGPISMRRSRRSQQPVVVMRAGTAAQARSLRSGRVAHSSGSGIALCPRARHRAARGFALHRHGRAGPGGGGNREDCPPLLLIEQCRARRIRSPLNTTSEIRSVAAISCSGLPSTSSRSASMPWRMAPMRSAAPSSFAALTVAACRATVTGIPACHPELQLAVQRGSVEDHRIAGIAAHHQRHAGLPGAQQVGARGVERALEQLRLGRVGALAGS